MQSAKGKTKVWRIDWDVLQGSGRWENPLMGWASSADYMQGTTLAFRTREDACRFAERQGWDYYVQEPKAARIPPKNYGKWHLHSSHRHSGGGRVALHHTTHPPTHDTFSPPTTPYNAFTRTCTDKRSGQLLACPWQAPHPPHQVDRTRRKCIISRIRTPRAFERRQAQHSSSCE